MNADFQPGDRVTWTERGVQRTGTIEFVRAASSKAYVKPDMGNRHWVSKAKLKKAEEQS